MAPCRDFIVVLVSDAGLRTSLIARLGMTGRTVVTAHDGSELARWDATNNGSTLIIDTASLPADMPVDVGNLRAHVWSGRLFVVGDQDLGEGPRGAIQFVEAATATADIMTALAKCA